MGAVALRKESVDRNVMEVDGVSYDVWSLSARRAWIEIFVPFDVIRPAIVALRKESVDRNACDGLLKIVYRVALRKESVDRNFSAVSDSLPALESLSARRAWIEIRHTSHDFLAPKSLSARRAWIEIKSRLCVKRCHASLSARRAWIEMSGY